MTKNQSLKLIFLIFGATGFSFSAGNSVHEFGHAIADWMSGIAFSKIHAGIHPFFAPHMTIDGMVPDSMMGWPDAAGPLANVVLGLLLFAIFWARRNPFTFPILLWAPLACVQEGIGQIMTVSDRGSDAARMVAAGFPELLLIVICILLILTGIVLFVLVFPAAGISPETRFFKRLWLIACGMIPWGLLTLLVSALASSNQQDVSRSYNVTGGFLIIAIIVAGVYAPVWKAVKRLDIRNLFNVEWRHGFSAAGLMAVVVVLELIFLN